MTTDIQPNDYPSFEDTSARDRAAKMSGALKVYADCRQYAVTATLAGDPVSAHLHRSGARRALHEYPALLAILEPESVPPEPVEMVACDCKGGATVPRNTCVDCAPTATFIGWVES